MEAAEDDAAETRGQPPGDATCALESRRLPAPLDLAGEGVPEEVEDLRGQHHGGHAKLAERLEDDARVARTDIAHLGADRGGVEEHRGLLEEVREGQDRDGPLVTRLQQAPEAGHRLEDVAVAEEHALGVGRRARREDDLEERAAIGCGPGGHLCLPIGREGIVGLGDEVLEAPDREVVEADLGRVWRIVAAVDGEPAGVRACRDAIDDPRGHAQVEGHDDDAGAHGTPVHGRQARGGGRPGEEAVAGPYAPRPKAPGRQQRAAPHLGG